MNDKYKWRSHYYLLVYKGETVPMEKRVSGWSTYAYKCAGLTKKMFLVALAALSFASLEVHAAGAPATSGSFFYNGQPDAKPNSPVATPKNLPTGITADQLGRMSTRRDNVEQRLNLTDDQIIKINAIRAQAKADIEKIQKAAKKELDAVLTQQQRAEIEKINKEKGRSR